MRLVLNLLSLPFFDIVVHLLVRVRLLWVLCPRLLFMASRLVMLGERRRSIRS